MTLWVAAAAALVLLVVGGVIGYLIGSSGGLTRLDPDKVAAGVTGVLQNNYKVEDVRNVSCPENMPVTVGASYTCTFTAGTSNGSVAITIQNDSGRYLVQAPKG